MIRDVHIIDNNNNESNIILQLLRKLLQIYGQTKMNKSNISWEKGHGIVNACCLLWFTNIFRYSCNIFPTISLHRRTIVCSSTESIIESNWIAGLVVTYNLWCFVISNQQKVTCQYFSPDKKIRYIIYRYMKIYYHFR